MFDSSNYKINWSNQVLFFTKVTLFSHRLITLKKKLQYVTSPFFYIIKGQNLMVLPPWRTFFFCKDNAKVCSFCFLTWKNVLKFKYIERNAFFWGGGLTIGKE